MSEDLYHAIQIKLRRDNPEHIGVIRAIESMGKRSGLPKAWLIHGFNAFKAISDASKVLDDQRAIEYNKITQMFPDASVEVLPVGYKMNHLGNEIKVDFRGDYLYIIGTSIRYMPTEEVSRTQEAQAAPRPERSRAIS